MIEYNNEFYGKVTYDLELEMLKPKMPLKLPFNGSECTLDFYIEDASPMYTQIKHHIKDYGINLHEIPNQLINLYKNNVQEQNEMFDEYLKDPTSMMRLFEDEIIKDFYEQREILLENETYFVREYEIETTEKIRTADTREKILDMIHFKELTLATNQIRIIGKCEYYNDIDYGVSITNDGTIYVGSVEMIYC